MLISHGTPSEVPDTPETRESFAPLLKEIRDEIDKETLTAMEQYHAKHCKETRAKTREEAAPD
jgi:hypothetical protein